MDVVLRPTTTDSTIVTTRTRKTNAKRTLSNGVVVAGVADDDDALVVLGGSAEESHSTDIDLLNNISIGHTGFLDGLPRVTRPASVQRFYLSRF
jgi:hypothetical protein